MTVTDFVNDVSAVSLPNVFNPYRDVCVLSDHADSAEIRRRNITLFLTAMALSQTRSLWIGRDLGYRGGRRTGIALTDEFHLDVLESTFNVAGLAKATVGSVATKERTATEVWKMLRLIKQPILLWNVFPFHPYEKDDPMSNRRHTAREFASCRHLLTRLVDWLQPTIIVALGADAEAGVTSIGHRCHRVRHPSYGGQAAFASDLSRIYGI